MSIVPSCTRVSLLLRDLLWKLQDLQQTPLRVLAGTVLSRLIILNRRNKVQNDVTTRKQEWLNDLNAFDEMRLTCPLPLALDDERVIRGATKSYII